jgi:hypothetical protein
MTELGRGSIRKMVSTVGSDIQYELPLGDSRLPMNALIGNTLRLEYLGEIRCVNCGRKTRKSFAQGHCFPCMRKLASCDGCIVRPETCHYAAGTCREPQWGETHCLIPHTVYLSNTGGVKVGITRGGNELVRWVDQGATQALAIRTVPERLISGLVETRLKQHVSDKTNWRVMLSGVPAEQPLQTVRDTLFETESGLAGDALPDAEIVRLNYPVLAYPEKVKSMNIDKLGTIEGTLQGIKGQYLIFDIGVINVRKYTGYHWAVFS